MHPSTLTSVNNLAFLLVAQGKLGDAEQFYRRALDGREQVLGPTHPATLDSVNNLACLLQTLGKVEEAKPLFERYEEWKAEQEEEEEEGSEVLGQEQR